MENKIIKKIDPWVSFSKWELLHTGAAILLGMVIGAAIVFMWFVG